VPAAIARQIAIMEPGQLKSSEKQPTAGGLVEPAHDVEQCRLTAAGWAEQHDHFAGGDIEIHAAQGLHFHLAGSVGLGKRLGGEHLVRHSRSNQR
jgi:hypothetical protein